MIRSSRSFLQYLFMWLLTVWSLFIKFRNIWVTCTQKKNIQKCVLLYLLDTLLSSKVCPCNYFGIKAKNTACILGDLKYVLSFGCSLSRLACIFFHPSRHKSMDLAWWVLNSPLVIKVAIGDGNIYIILQHSRTLFCPFCPSLEHMFILHTNHWSIRICVYVRVYMMMNVY